MLFLSTLSTRDRRRARSGLRPPKLAPAGVRPPQYRLDRAPDGWERVGSSATERFMYRLDASILRMADGAARVISRREVLRRAGELSILAGLGASGVLWSSKSARASDPTCSCNCLDTNNQEPGPCGPSPICGNSLNCNSNGNCKTSRSVDGEFVRRRNNQSNNTWPGSSCASNTSPNCWEENCCSQRGHRVRCCDCCTPDNSTPNCSGCTNTKHKCICRKNVANC